MNFILFIFNLIDAFVPMEEKEQTRMRNEAWNWYRSINFYDPENPETHDWRNHLKTYSEKWYTKLGLAVLYLFLLRWISVWLSGVKQTSKPSNDDEQ
jgi:hypothetical protein